MVNRVVIAICKHVIAEDVLTSGCVGVGVDEPGHVGIVISGLEIVERGLSVLCVPMVGKWYLLQV